MKNKLLLLVLLIASPSLAADAKGTLIETPQGDHVLTLPQVVDGERRQTEVLRFTRGGQVVFNYHNWRLNTATDMMLAHFSDVSQKVCEQRVDPAEFDKVKAYADKLEKQNAELREEYLQGPRFSVWSLLLAFILGSVFITVYLKWLRNIVE